MKQLFLLLLTAAFVQPVMAQVNLGTNSGASGGTTNTFIGESAGQSNSTGTHNTIMGYRALMANTSGVGNVAVGNDALFNNTTGNTNIAIGRYALFSTTTVNNSIAIGLNSLYYNTSGSMNVALGVNTLSANTTGGQNVAMGHMALNLNTSTSGSVAIGYRAADSSTYSQVTAVGYNSDIKGNSGSAYGAYAWAGEYGAAYGKLSSAMGMNSTALGSLAEGSQTGSIAIGYQARSLNTGSIALGYSITTTASNQFLVGNSTANQGIRDVYIGSGVTATNATANGPLTIQPTGQDGTDQAGQTIRIASGKGTGTGTPGDIVFLSGTAGASGSTLQSIAEKMIIKGNTGNVGIGVTTPSALLHTNGTVRMQGIAKDNAFTRVLVSDADGNLRYRDDSTFEAASGSSNGWSFSGNAGINSASDFLGTTDNTRLAFRTNNTQRLSILPDGTVSIGSSDTAAKTMFRFYPNGDFTSGARSSLAGNTFGPNNGIRYNAKYGTLEIGTNNNFDTSKAINCCGAQVKSALVINSDFMNTFKGHIHASAIGGDGMTVDTAGAVMWSTVFGESHYINASINKTTISGFGHSIRKTMANSLVTGQSIQFLQPVTNSIIAGNAHTTADTVSLSLVSGSSHSYGGAGQFLSGIRLINKTPFGSVVGSGNVDFASTAYTGNKGLSLSTITDLNKYPVFAIGNSGVNAGAAMTRSNALTVLYNGRTQINTNGYRNNLAESDVTPKAALEIVSKNSGILIPRLTNDQRDSIVSGDLQNGLLIYNLTSAQFQFFNGSSWRGLGDSSVSGATAPVLTGWGINGNTGTTSTSFIGTLDNQPVVFRAFDAEAMRIAPNGNVGIGTAALTDTSYKLLVDGGIRSRQVTVDQDNWADYVFEDTYRLPTLAEVESYIKANKHLPDMPSAKEVAAKGINIGDNQALLLRKIEELTLYSIDQNKQIEKQNRQIEKQQEQINQLLKLLKKD